MSQATKTKTRQACPHQGGDCPVLSELNWLRRKCNRLQDLVETDALTGLYNLRYLLRSLEGEMERTRRSALPTSLVMIDLDHFKDINDTYGHEAGNRVLQWMAMFFRRHTRSIDITCRYGGEEFAIVLPGTRLAMARQVAERLRSALAKSRLPLDGKTVGITASFGVDTYRGRSTTTAKGFIARTDNYLLEAKAAGRNRVCHPASRPATATTQITAQERESLFARVDRKPG